MFFPNLYVPYIYGYGYPYGSPEFLYGLSESVTRRFSENRDYGSKLTYDPSWTGPLNVKRSMTSLPGLVIFILLFIYWVGVACYAFMFGDLKKFFASTSDSDPSRYLSSSVNDLYDVRWIIIGILLIAVLSSFLCLVLLSIGAEETIYISFLLRITMMVLALSWFIYLLVEMSWEKQWNLDETWFLCRNIFMVVIFIAILLFMLCELALSRGLNCEIIQELTKAVVFFPSLFIYSLLVYTILFAMAGVCIAVQWSLQSIDGLPESFLIINYIIEILCLIWFNCFLSAFLKLIASGSYATWYWTRNNQEVPKFTTMRFIGITLRYYVGTSTFGSCFMPVNEGMAKAYMMLHGTSFFESARISNNLLHRNKRAKQIYGEICCEWILLVISIVSVSCILYKAVLLITLMEEFQSSWAQLLACFIILRTVYWMLDLLQVAIDTIFICILEDFEVNGNSDRPHYMSDKLKVLIPNPQTEQ